MFCACISHIRWLIRDLKYKVLASKAHHFCFLYRTCLVTRVPDQFKTPVTSCLDKSNAIRCDLTPVIMCCFRKLQNIEASIMSLFLKSESILHIGNLRAIFDKFCLGAIKFHKLDLWKTFWAMVFFLPPDAEQMAYCPKSVWEGGLHLGYSFEGLWETRKRLRARSTWRQHLWAAKRESSLCTCAN